MDQGHGRRKLQIAAVDPPTGDPTGYVQISTDRLQNIAKRSKGQILEAARCVPEVLQNPTAIYQGLTCDEDEDKRGYGWRCYCGIPDHAYHADGTSRAAYLGQVFLVFVNDELIAYNWRWEKADPDVLSTPKSADTRFKERLL